MDADVLCDLLMLVDCNIPLWTVEGWTQGQRELAAKWAGKMHLKASDNNVRVPPIPAFLIFNQPTPVKDSEEK